MIHSKLSLCLSLLLASASLQAQETDSRWLGVSDFASWSQDGSQIVFHSSRDGNFEVYVMNADGSNQRRLTHNPWSDANPSFSPDGRSIAFNSNREGWGVGEPAGQQIYVLELETGEVRDLTREPYDWDQPNAPHSSSIYPRWGKDGRIAFLSNRANGWMEIYVMNGDGSDRRQLTYHRQHHYNIHWEQDQSGIFFDTHVDGLSSATGDGGWEIQSVDLQGSGRTDVTSDRRHENYDGTTSPDGSQLIYNRSGEPGLFLMSTDGSMRSDEPFIAESAFSPRWSPDGRKLLFTSGRNGHRELYVKDLQTGETIRLTWSRGTE